MEYDPDGSPPGWEALSIGEVNTTFAGLTDTPNSYTDQAGKIVRVKGDETGLEFVDEASGVPGSFTTLTVSGNTTLGDNAAEDTVTVLALPTLEIDGNLVNGGWTVDYYSSTAAQGGQITGRRAAGTKASPSAVASGTTLVSYVGRGYDGSAFSGARAGMYLLTAEAWDGSSHGTRLRFQTTPVGSTSPSNAVSIEPDNAVLINTTTNNGVDKLQVNGSVSASGKVKLTTSDELVTAHGNMGATETFDASVSNVHSGTLDANCTFTLSNPSSSGRQTCLYLYITQDGTGSRTITWPGSAVGEGGGAVPAGSTAAGATDLWVCTTIDGGTSWYVALAIKGS